MDKPVAVVTGGARGIGKAIARRFLAYGQGGFITGANFPVDGGMTRKMIYV